MLLNVIFNGDFPAVMLWGDVGVVVGSSSLGIPSP